MRKQNDATIFPQHHKLVHSSHFSFLKFATLSVQAFISIIIYYIALHVILFDAVLYNILIYLWFWQTKENENHLLRDRLSQQEQENRKAVEKAKIDVREQIEQAVQNEKKIWEKEQKYAENEQLKQYRLISYESIIAPHNHCLRR